MIVSWLAGGALVDIEFDATMRELHQTAVSVTEYHVERGADVADHARPEHDKITFDVVVTNTPLRVPATNTDGTTGQFSSQPLETQSLVHLPKLLPGVGLAETLIPRQSDTTLVEVLNFNGVMDRVKSVYNDLTFLAKSTTLVQISTPLREYENMVIRSVTAPRQAPDGGCITFTVEATEIRFVDSEVVAVKADAIKKKSKGVKPGVKADAPLTSSGKETLVRSGVASRTVRSARVPAVP